MSDVQNQPPSTGGVASHLATVDALRGFAALAVCLFHLGGSSLPKFSSPTTSALTSWGWAGVEVFFVISGFVIPYVMLRANYRLADAPLFMARRVVRIWPPSAILILVTAAQYFVAERFGRGNASNWGDVSLARVLANLTYSVPFTGQEWLNGVLWTLSVEFQFYLVLALIFPLFKRGPLWVGATMLASCLAFYLPFAETILFFTYAIYFALGGVALMVHQRILERAPALVLLVAMAAIAGLQGNWVAAGFGFAAGILIAFASLSWRPLLFLGSISYSLYLVHILVASTLEFVVVRTFAPAGPGSRLFWQLVCVAAAIIGAWAFTRFIETPFVQLSQRMGKRPARRAPDTAGSLRPDAT